MITLKEFRAFEKVRDSGKANMNDLSLVQKLSYDLCAVHLTKSMIIEIMNNYTELKRKMEFK